MIRSESTKALGQPSDTKPTRGSRTSCIRLRIIGCFMNVNGGAAQQFSTEPCAAAPGCGSSTLLLVVGAALRRRGERGKGEGGEHSTCLVLHALLHIHEELGALLEITAEHPLHRRRLHLDELLPEIRRQHHLVAVNLLCLLLQLLLNGKKRLHVLLDVLPHDRLLRATVEADHLCQYLRAEPWST